jgi:DNA-binding NtrC family response regulator
MSHWPLPPQNYLGMEAVIHSAAMRDIMSTVQRAASTNAAVLITGESGTGKEVVARAVHCYSTRSNGPWIDVSCAALPDHLVESELFGYEKGAFTNATGAKRGFFELADQGTLFLDEIGELDLRLQVKLLRVLDGTSYYRIGGTRKVNCNARIVAATNRNLIAEGFRNDLYHRICQIHVHIPALRERRDDIAPLAMHFLRQQNPQLSFADDAIAALQAYSWPGNVRELRNVVINAALRASRTVVRAFDLPVMMPEAKPVRLSIVDTPCNLSSVERDTILEALRSTNGHRQRAADLLGISRRTLIRKLNVYRGTSDISPVM